MSKGEWKEVEWERGGAGHRCRTARAVALGQEGCGLAAVRRRRGRREDGAVAQGGGSGGAKRSDSECSVKDGTPGFCSVYGSQGLSED